MKCDIYEPRCMGMLSRYGVMMMDAWYRYLLRHPGLAKSGACAAEHCACAADNGASATEYAACTGACAADCVKFMEYVKSLHFAIFQCCNRVALRSGAGGRVKPVDIPCRVNPHSDVVTALIYLPLLRLQ